MSVSVNSAGPRAGAHLDGLNGGPLLLPFDIAQAAVIAACPPLSSERIQLDEARGRVAVDAIVAREDLVPFARSAMDGFAVRAADIGALPALLPVAGSAFAAPGEARLTPHSACAIATGAALPLGADAVIPIEHVETRGGSIRISRPVTPGAAVFPPGDDARRGDVLVAAGTSLDAATIGLLAAAGIVEVDVYRRPRVAIVCGGDELVAIETTPGYGQIRNSNGHMLAAAVVAAGGVLTGAPVCLRDTRGAVRAALVAAFDGADLVVTSGGASVGERDFIKPICAELGVHFTFRTVALRPSKPTAFGRLGGTAVVVLPGNPAAAFVGFMEFAGPAIRALGGRLAVRPPRVSARLEGSIRAKPGRHFAAFAALRTGPDGFRATPLDNQCSSLTRTAVDAAGCIIVPPGSRRYSSGDRVDVDIFDWAKLQT